MPQPRAVRWTRRIEFTVAAYNLERFFDTVNDPAVGETVLTAAAFASAACARPRWASAITCTRPDILGVVEVENLSTLQTLADRINADAVAAGQPDPQYVAYLQEGNDIGGIDVGFLVKTADVAAGVARVEVAGGHASIGKDTTWTEPDGAAACSTTVRRCCSTPWCTTPTAAPSRSP